MVFGYMVFLCVLLVFIQNNSQMKRKKRSASCGVLYRNSQNVISDTLAILIQIVLKDKFFPVKSGS